MRNKKQRLNLAKCANQKFFIGSSVESKYIAYAIQPNLEYVAWCTIWEHAFLAPTITIDSLISEASQSDLVSDIFDGFFILKVNFTYQQ